MVMHMHGGSAGGMMVHEPDQRVTDPIGISDGQARCKLCPVSLAGFRPRSAAVEVDDPPGFGEAEAQAAAGFAAGEEGIEDVGADVGRDAGAGVGDGQEELRSAECGMRSGADRRVRGAECGVRSAVRGDWLGTGY